MGFMKDTVKRVMPYVGSDERKARTVIRMVLQSIASGLINGKEVQIRRFGSFKVVKGNARTARNPSTNEQIVVPATKRIRFKPSENLNRVVRNSNAQIS